MKFQKKIMLCMVGLLAVLFGIGGGLLIHISFDGMLKQEQNRAHSSYEMLTQTMQIVDNVDIWNTDNDIGDTLRAYLQNENMPWSACRMYADGHSFFKKGDQTLFKDMDQKTDLSHYTISYVQGGKNEKYMQLSGKLKMGSFDVKLDVLYDISDIYRLRTQQEKTFYGIFALLLFSCIVGAGILSWFLTRPVTQLSEAANAIAGGDYSCRSQIDSEDEIGMLSRDFDNMAEKVEESMEQIRKNMEHQEQFMGSFAHELKTPLTSVIGYADLIRSQCLSGEDEQEAANYIFSEGKRLESLSKKLLAIFQVNGEVLELIPCEPGKIVEQLVEHLRVIYENEKIQLNAACEPGICMLEPELFQSMIINFVDNARKALDHGGNIDLSCQMTADGCEIAIRDSGRGIPAESLEHLTEAFYRVDKARSRAQGGAGLGLTLCQKIIEIHQGELKISSEPGKGTCVTVWLRGGRA